MRMDLAHLASKFHCDTRCGNPEHFDDYIRYNSIADTITGMGVTHVALGYDDDGNAVKIQGFVTLKTNSVVSWNEKDLDGYRQLRYLSLLSIEMLRGKDSERLL